MEDLIFHLKEIGFNSYESKVYLALLKNYPATGYEVSKNSGVPQARAYDTLKVLENRKVIVSSGEKPQTYSPVRPEELIDKYEKKINGSIDYLKENLPSLSDDYVEPVLNLRGSISISQQLKDMIESAEKEIFIELWDVDFKEIKDSLKKAYERGVDIKIVGYNNPECDFGVVYQHGLGDSIEETMGGRWIIAAVDNNIAIAGVISSTKNVPNVVCTRNLDLVLIIKEVVVHDMFLLDVEAKLGKEMTEIYGKDLIKLRNKILGKDFVVKMH